MIRPISRSAPAAQNSLPAACDPPLGMKQKRAVRLAVPRSAFDTSPCPTYSEPKGRRVTTALFLAASAVASAFPESRLFLRSPRIGPVLRRCYTPLQGHSMARGNFGERLKRERELREVTLEEITAATRIGSRFLEALENEDWSKLPGGVFNRGFVRSIARYLGLDEEALLGEYDLAHGTQVAPVPPQPEHRMSSSKWIPFLVFVGVLVLLFCAVAGGVYFWRHHVTRRAQTQSTTSVSPAADTPGTSASDSPASQQKSDAPSPAQPPLDLLVSASAATRVHILADGRLLFDGELLSGESRHFQAVGEFEVTAADSSAVLLELNGQAMPPLGTPGASGTMTLGRKDLRQASGGNAQP
jgi:cytoskeleton protein RodZ